MFKNRFAKRFMWILSLTFGPVIYCILLLALPGRPGIEALERNLIELVVTIVVYWAAGFGLVWGLCAIIQLIVKSCTPSKRVQA